MKDAADCIRRNLAPLTAKISELSNRPTAEALSAAINAQEFAKVQVAALQTDNKALEAKLAAAASAASETKTAVACDCAALNAQLAQLTKDLSDTQNKLQQCQTAASAPRAPSQPAPTAAAAIAATRSDFIKLQEALDSAKKMVSDIEGKCRLEQINPGAAAAAAAGRAVRTNQGGFGYRYTPITAHQVHPTSQQYLSPKPPQMMTHSPANFVQVPSRAGGRAQRYVRFADPSPPFYF